jgi:bleomycin hydrolase
VLEQLKAREAREKEAEETKTTEERERARRERKSSPTGRLEHTDPELKKPSGPEVFTSAFHFPPVSQDRTGTCWSFATTSFFESESQHRTGKKIRLSEMYFVYFEYVEKALYFVRQRGEMNFSPGSEANAVLRMLELHGAVPLEAYRGVLNDTPHDHQRLHRRIDGYLKYVKDNGIWEEDVVVAEVRRMLDAVLGAPPTAFSFEGVDYTPRDFADNVLGIRAKEYVVTMSTLSLPFHTRGVLEVDDNWWRSGDYVNLPLDAWYSVFRDAVKAGYSISVCGDVSEPGHVGKEDIAIIPDYDIPSAYINQDARELRIVQESTTDDHCVHCVGYVRLDDADWFLIKDSSRVQHPGRFEGYHFYRGDYVRLKMLSYLIHQDALGAILDRIGK